jgi:hypothetical protein
MTQGMSFSWGFEPIAAVWEPHLLELQTAPKPAIGAPGQ